MTRLFGTDGIRGVANEAPLTADLAYRVGRQLVATLQAERGVARARLVIGRDTRRSGPLLESALVAGEGRPRPRAAFWTGVRARFAPFSRP